MPFYLYRLDGDAYVRVRSNVPLAGLQGPFFATARRAPDNPEWELSETELVRYYGVDPDSHVFIIDLKPKVQDKVSLYRLKHIWGYSSNGWTPLALELEELYVDKKPPAGISAAAFKQRFANLSEPGNQIYEFLYVFGDGKAGSWSFGRVGSVNAALLWDDVLDSFLKRINRKRRDIDDVPLLGRLD